MTKTKTPQYLKSTLRTDTKTPQYVKSTLGTDTKTPQYVQFTLGQTSKHNDNLDKEFQHIRHHLDTKLPKIDDIWVQRDIAEKCRPCLDLHLQVC